MATCYFCGRELPKGGKWVCTTCGKLHISVIACPDCAKEHEVSA